MIELGRQEEDSDHLGVCYEVASFTNVSLIDDECFDAIVSFMALTDDHNYEGAIKEIIQGAPARLQADPQNHSPVFHD